MPKIKIISNPYRKEVKYQKWSAEEDQWVDIDYENHKNSKLFSNDLTGGFFPFQVKKIVDLLIEEYETEGEQLEIVFEGTADEYRELEAVCKEENYKAKVSVSRSSVVLENARDILPDVRALFQEMSPLIVRSVSYDKIQRDLNRFTDASSDVVPICVLGNYSAGKSTFINAMIGSEILPSGSEPVTAKVYKITRAKYSDRASVKCRYLDFDVTVTFTDTETRFSAGMVENPLSQALKAALSEIEDASIVLRVNRTLSVINDYENSSEGTEISDLIEVDIPFAKGILAESQHPFVIFDTPGSNSASNARHLIVLKQAMANMTNGLPIFLSAPDSLDSTDNEDLYHIIREMDELDSRFTMIVVNKADGPGLGRRDSVVAEQSRILNQAVPRNLYSGGLFYVSSILGLGAKNSGEFIDDYCAEIFEDQVRKYNNPQEKRYRRLYTYNIMPLQIKSRADASAAAQTDLVYANSGLFSVETEIEAFAGKYAAYNKCFQSQMFLHRVIDITRENIAERTATCEGIRQSIRDKLEADKKALLDRIEAETNEKHAAAEAAYPDFMQTFVAGAGETFSADELKQKQALFTTEQEDEVGFSRRVDDVKRSREGLTSNLRSNFANAFKQRNTESFREIAEDFQADMGSAAESLDAQKRMRHLVDKAAADRLLQYVSEDYKSSLAKIYNLLDQKSRQYWMERTEEIRDILSRVVAGSSVLTEERREDLKRIIVEYRSITFSDQEMAIIFNRGNFERSVKIGALVFWQSDHLNINKLAKTYNTNMIQGVDERYRLIEKSHGESVTRWIESLLDEICRNIIEYSPELSRQAEQIREMTAQIEDLEGRQMQLTQYSNQLREMMDWKPVQA